MIFFPKNLSCLARLCAGSDGRFSMTGPKVYEYEGGFYRVVASDGYRLATVAGPGVDPKELNTCSLDVAPNGVYESVVPSKDWVEAFKLCGKYPNGDAEPLGMVMGPGRVTFATIKGMRSAVPVDGRYPDWPEILPKKPPVCRFRVNPKFLSEVLAVAAHFCPDDATAVDLAFYPHGDAGILGVVCRNEGQTFDAIVVCLTTPK